MPKFNRKRTGPLSAEEKKTIAKSATSINLNNNPFENIQQQRKKQILGTSTSQVRHTSKARSNDINIRKDTLLKDFWKQQKPSNQFVDKRQLAFEKTLSKVDKKRKKFQIGEDDDEGTMNEGKKTKLSSFSSLGDIDEAIDRDLFRDDYQADDIDSKFSTNDEVSVLRNLKGIARGEASSTFTQDDQMERKLSKRERMNLRIRGFKEKKLEQKMEKEENLEMIQLLDSDMDDLMKHLNVTSNNKTKEHSETSSNKGMSNLDYDNFMEMIKKGEDIDLNELLSKKNLKSNSLPMKETSEEVNHDNSDSDDDKVEEENENDEEDEIDLEKTVEEDDDDSNVDESYLKDSFIDDNNDSNMNEEGEDHENTIEEDEKSIEEDEEVENTIVDEEDENIIDEEEDNEQDSTHEQESSSLDDSHQTLLEASDEDLQSLNELFKKSISHPDVFSQLVQNNSKDENEKLFSTLVTFMVKQFGFSEWLNNDSTVVNFKQNILDNTLNTLFMLTTKLPNIAHDVFHTFLLELFNKYQDQTLPNLGELLVLKMITRVYPLRERIDSPLLSLTNLLIHLYLEKSSKFIDPLLPITTRTVLFLVSLAIIIDCECTFYSPDVVNTLQLVFMNHSNKDINSSSSSSNNGKKKKRLNTSLNQSQQHASKNLFRSLFEETCQSEIFSDLNESWARHLLSIYSNHLATDFTKSIISNEHYKTLITSSEGIKTTHRDHIENYNIIFEGFSKLITSSPPPQQQQQQQQPLITPVPNEIKTHLNYKTKRPKPIVEFEPFFGHHDSSNIDSAKSKYTFAGTDPQQTKLKTLRKKISREKRKAMSELRKDNQFLRSAREQIASEEAFQRKEKYKEVLDSLRRERLEQNQIDRKNKEIDKMKKDMRINRKNVGRMSAAVNGGKNDSKKK
ncbi:hypothetical protein C9374_005451 [Naegleria lovaniensis]|uniref:Nop14-like protein n=1 Tax=Naegleria lovaniensis TaxID=51637 RepID=A0AA88KHX4_NAELO|nr:uncharacterized protein C9374_005451 [Naegleria lovaniensis]KAG2382249.1 hypothetical protein C9374_005451 [Naegleria lovaniensis]